MTKSKDGSKVKSKGKIKIIKKPKVLIVMGSDSDLPVMEKAEEVLNDMGVACEMDISSAHRTPHKTASLVTLASRRGIEVIIAGAGMSAHLPGVVASYTIIPVIGVPLSSKTATHSLNGLDSLFSIVQMPPGVPVATVGIDRADNAAYMACAILSIKYPRIAQKLLKHRQKMLEKVKKAAKKLKEKRGGKKS